MCLGSTTGAVSLYNLAGERVATFGEPGASWPAVLRDLAPCMTDDEDEGKGRTVKDVKVAGTPRNTAAGSFPTVHSVSTINKKKITIKMHLL